MKTFNFLIILGIVIILKQIGFAQHFSFNAIPYLSNNKYGLSDIYGNLIIEPQYQDVQLFPEFGVIACKKDSLWTLYNYNGIKIFTQIIENGKNSIPNSWLDIIRDDKGNELDYPDLYQFKNEDTRKKIYFNPHKILKNYKELEFESKDFKPRQHLIEGDYKPHSEIFRIYVGNMMNFVDSTGQVLFNENLYNAEVCSKDLLVLQNKDFHYAFYSTSGKQLTDYFYSSDYIWTTSSPEHFIVQRLNKQGDTREYVLLNNKGEDILVGSNEQFKFININRIVLNKKIKTNYKTEYNAYILNYTGDTIKAFKNRKINVLNENEFSIMGNEQCCLINSHFDTLFCLDSISILSIRYFLKKDSTKIKTYIFHNNSRTYQKGILDSLGNVKVDPLFESSLSITADGYIKFQTDDKFGVVNFEGDTLIPLQKNQIVIENDLIKVFEDNGRFDIYSKGKKLTNYVSNKTKTTDNPWKVFFVNIDGDPLCKPIYRWIHDKQCNSKLLYFAALDTTLVGKTVFDIYNENAKKINPEGYVYYPDDDAFGYPCPDPILKLINFDDLVTIQKYKGQDYLPLGIQIPKVGVIDINGNWILHPSDKITENKLDFFVQSDTSQLFFDVFNLDGKKINKISYNYLYNSYLKSKMVIVARLSNPDILEKLPKSIFQKRRKLYTSRYWDHNQIFLQNGIYHFGFLNEFGMEVVKLKYDKVNDYFYTFTTASKKNKHDKNTSYVIDKKGNELLKTNYESLEIFFEDSTKLKTELNGKYGMIDLSGNVILEPKYINIETIDGSLGFYLLYDTLNYYISDSKGNCRIIDECNHKANNSKENSNISLNKIQITALKEGYFIFDFKSGGYKIYDKNLKELFSFCEFYKIGFYGESDRRLRNELVVPKGYLSLQKSKDNRQYLFNLKSGFEYKSEN